MQIRSAIPRGPSWKPIRSSTPSPIQMSPQLWTCSPVTLQRWMQRPGRSKQALASINCKHLVPTQSPNVLLLGQSPWGPQKRGKVFIRTLAMVGLGFAHATWLVES